jgi:Family of unknown function (DUF6152)
MHEHTHGSRSLAFGGALIALFLLTGLAASAHHGWEGYRNEDFQISGVVEVPVSLAGPHASLKIRADGQLWNVVLAPPPRTERAGLKTGMIPVGAQVTAYGHRHRDPKTLEIKTERLRWNDRVFNVYPDRT